MLERKLDGGRNGVLRNPQLALFIVHCTGLRVGVGHQGIIQAQNITALKYQGTICDSLLYHEYEEIKLKKFHLIL